MGNILHSLSKTGKDLKHRLRGKQHRPGRTEANTPGESTGLSGLLLRLEPHVVAGGHDGEGNGISTDVQQDRSKDQSPQPEPMLAGGSNGDRERGRADVHEKEEAVSRSHSRLGLDVEAAVDGEASREANRVYPSPSTGKPDSA